MQHGIGTEHNTTHQSRAKKRISIIVRKKIRKRRLFKKVQAFCEEKVLRYLLGLFGMLNPKTNVGKLKNGVFTI